MREPKVGDKIYIWCRGRGGHGAYITITKLNKKTMSGVEEDKSYCPGMKWNINKKAVFAFIEGGGLEVVRSVWQNSI